MEDKFKMGLKMECEGVKLIYLAQNCVCFLAFVNTVMNLSVK